MRENTSVQLETCVLQISTQNIPSNANMVRDAVQCKTLLPVYAFSECLPSFRHQRRAVEIALKGELADSACDWSRSSLLNRASC